MLICVDFSVLLYGYGACHLLLRRGISPHEFRLRSRLRVHRSRVHYVDGYILDSRRGQDSSGIKVSKGEYPFSHVHDFQLSGKDERRLNNGIGRWSFRFSLLCIWLVPVLYDDTTGCGFSSLLTNRRFEHKIQRGVREEEGRGGEREASGGESLGYGAKLI